MWCSLQGIFIKPTSYIFSSKKKLLFTLSGSFRGAGSLSEWSNVVPEHASLITPGYTSGICTLTTLNPSHNIMFHVFVHHCYLSLLIYLVGSYALKITSTINSAWVIRQSLVNIKQWAGCKVLLSSTLKAFNVSRPSIPPVPSPLLLLLLL